MRMIKEAELADGCKMNLSLHEGARYSGFKEADTYEVTFLSPADEPNSFYTNNTEIYAINELEMATRAFDERAAMESPWKYSSFYRPLYQVLEAE